MKKCWLLIIIFLINGVMPVILHAEVNIPFLCKLKERQLATEFKRGKKKNDEELQAAVIQVATEKGYDELIRRLTAEDVIRVLKKILPEQQNVIEKIVDILAERSKKELEEIYNALKGSPSGQALVESMQKAVAAGEFPVAKLPAGIAPPGAVPLGLPAVPPAAPPLLPDVGSPLAGVPPLVPGPGLPGVLPRAVGPQPATLPPVDLEQLSQKEKNLSDLRFLQTLDDLVQVDALGKIIEKFSKEVVDLLVERLAKNEGFKKRKELGILTGKRFEQADKMHRWYQQEIGSQAQNEKEINDYLMQNSLSSWIKNNYTSLATVRQAIERGQLQQELAKILVPLVFDVDVIEQDARYHIEYFVVTAGEPLRVQALSTLSRVARGVSNQKVRTIMDAFKEELRASREISAWVAKKDISNVRLSKNYIQDFFVIINRLRLDNAFKPNLVILSGREKNAMKNIDRLLGEAVVKYARGLRGLDQEYYAPLLTGSVVGGGSKLVRTPFIGRLVRQLFFVESIKDVKILPAYQKAVLVYQDTKDKYDAAEQLAKYFSDKLRRADEQLKKIISIEFRQKQLFEIEEDEEKKEKKRQTYEEIITRHQALENEKTKIISKEQKAQVEFSQQVKKLQKVATIFEEAKEDYEDMVKRFDVVLRDYNNKIDESISKRFAKANFSLAIIDALSGVQKFPALKKRFEKLRQESWITGGDRATINNVVDQLNRKSISIDAVVRLLSSFIDDENREQGKEAIDNVVAVFKAYQEENAQFLFIWNQFEQVVTEYKRTNQPVFGPFYSQVKNKYGHKWGTNDRVRRFLEDMYRVSDSDLMSIGISRQEAREIRMKGGDIKNLFLKKFGITEQDVWNMLEPYGIVLTIFDKAISTKASLQDILSSLRLALGTAKDDPSIQGEVEGINAIIQLHKKYRLSPKMKKYDNIVGQVIIKNLAEYNVSPVLQVLQELVRKGQVIEDKDPKLLKLYNGINERLITAVIQDMRSILNNVLKGTVEQVAGIVFDEENNLDLFVYLANNENIRLLLKLIPGSFIQLKNAQYAFDQEKFNEAVQGVVEGIGKEFNIRFSQEADRLRDFFGMIKKAIPDLVAAAKKQYS